MHLLGKKTVLRYSAEQELAQHIKDLAAVGFPCSCDDVTRLAYDYATQNQIPGFSDKKKTKSRLLLVCWLYASFPRAVNQIRREPVLASCNEHEPNSGRQWFDKYAEILQRLGIRDSPRYIWNFDETACQNIHYANEVVGQVGVATYNITATEKGETSTALIGINALGKSPPPVIIHKGKNVGKGWSNGAPY